MRTQTLFKKKAVPKDLIRQRREEEDEIEFDAAEEDEEEEETEKLMMKFGGATNMDFDQKNKRMV